MGADRNSCCPRTVTSADNGRNHRPVINGILRRLRTGAPVREMAEWYGPWQTCYDRFVHWRRGVTGSPNSGPP